MKYLLAIIVSLLIGVSVNAADDGYFNNLTVDQTLTVTSVDAKYLSAKGLLVFGSGVVEGDLEVTNFFKSLSARITNLSVVDIISFTQNQYAGIKAWASTLHLKSSQILYTRWDGRGVCHINKSLPLGTKTEWRWLGDDGKWISTNIQTEVPTQCLFN